MLRPVTIARTLIVGALISGVGALGAYAAPQQTHHPRNTEHTVHSRHAIEHNVVHSCGEFMYFHDGKCTDARGKPGAPWTAKVF